MKFPDFNDFIAEITSDDNNDELYNPIIPIKFDENGNIKSSCLPDIIEKVTQRCEQFSLLALRKYHLWLLKQLSDDREN